MNKSQKLIGLISEGWSKDLNGFKSKYPIIDFKKTNVILKKISKDNGENPSEWMPLEDVMAQQGYTTEESAGQLFVTTPYYTVIFRLSNGQFLNLE